MSALALYRTGDYAKAGVPMLPVVAGKAETRRQILIYASLLVPLSFAPLALGMAGIAYGMAVAALIIERALATAFAGWGVN